MLHILIPDGEYALALSVVHSLSHRTDLNLQLHAITNKLFDITRFSRCCYTHSFKFSQDDVEARYEAVNTVSKKVPIDIIFPVSEVGAGFVAAKRTLLHQNFKIPAVPDAESLELVSNKQSLTEFAHNLQIPTPHTVFLKHGTQMDRAIDTMPFPALMKPLTESDGRGIIHLESIEDLEDELARPVTELYQQGGLIQEFLPGSNIDLSFLSVEGRMLACTIQKKIASYGKPFRMGKVIKFVNHEEVLQHGKKLLAALNWNGIGHLDFVCRENDEIPCLIDFNSRYWGTLNGSTLAGVNFPMLHCLTALDASFPYPAYNHINYAKLNLKELFLKPVLRSEVGRISLLNESNFAFDYKDPLPFLLPFLLRPVSGILPKKIKELIP